MIVNILPLSHVHDTAQMRERVMAGLAQLANARHWHGRRVGLKLHLKDDVLTFGGGRYHMSPRDIRFVSIDFDISRRSETPIIEQWTAQFHQLILIVDARELMESDCFRHEVVIRRLALPAVERHSDTLLMLLDVDNIMTIAHTGDYATTYLGMCAAFADKPYNASRLHPAFQQVWNQEAPLYLAQRQHTYRRRFSHRRVAMPQQLVCHTNQLEHAGYKELLAACLNCATRAHSIHLSNLSTLQTYNNMLNNDFLKRLTKAKQPKDNLRLAVIGATASGKSYLLTDAVAALVKMGFRPHDVDGHPSTSMFESLVNDYSTGVNSTPVYACRPTNHFASRYESEQRGGFTLNFLDIPGEVVTQDSINEASAIIRALSKHKSKDFIEKTWSNGSRTWKTVEFSAAHNGSSQENSPEESKQTSITLAGAQDSKQSLLGNIKTDDQTVILNNGGRTRAYQSNEVVFKELRTQRFSVIGTERSISGQHILGHFEEYVTDTVINAIIDAWEALDLDAELTNVSCNETYGNTLRQDDSKKTRFVKVYKNHFYFHYYIFFATDIVICDKCTLPDGLPIDQKEKTDSTKHFWGMIAALKVMFGQKGISKKELYLAFKGIDAVMQQSRIQQLWKKTTDLNLCYSHFLAILFAMYHQGNQDKENVFDEDNEDSSSNNEGCLATDLDAYGEFVAGNTMVPKLCFKDYIDPSIYPQYIKNEESIQTTSIMPFYEHIFNRIASFLGIPDAIGVPKDPSCVGNCFGGVPPHVHFTATPIDNGFTICEHDKEHENRLFKGNAADPSMRICFGTRQLVTDILLQHELKLQEQDKDFGIILSYVFNNKKPK